MADQAVVAGREGGGDAGAVSRAWTFEGARAVLPDVRARTERAAEAAERLVAARENAKSAQQQARIDREIQAVIERWAREMEALGAEVKGVWLVDFDTGSGYYCWRWPEETLEHFHGYDDGFAGRMRIQ
ncbi:MAG: DUF2203 domain-containing protein [Proteobacteria bacterium]|nr:MAG: DUF2203 domain-containing protein [Pseudomonadota bacterium]